MTIIYDDIFKKYTETFFPIEYSSNSDFQMQFKAQGMAESNLKRNAVSPVGAMGIMQIMPGTFKEQCAKLKIANGDPFDPELSIQVGIFYNSYLFKQQRAFRPFEDRMCFTFASYNAGLGNILKAQKFCIKYYKQKDPNLQKSIVDIAHFIDSWKSEETITYISRILNNYKKMVEK